MVKTLTRSPDCPPAAGSLNPAALNDTKAVFECLLWLVTVPFQPNCSFSRYVFDLPTLGPQRSPQHPVARERRD